MELSTTATTNSEQAIKLELVINLQDRRAYWTKDSAMGCYAGGQGHQIAWSKELRAQYLGGTHDNILWFPT
jgi:hypothetical protein